MSEQPPSYPPYQYPQAPNDLQPPPYQVPVAPDGRPLAGAGQRLGARLLDGLLYLVVVVLVMGVIVGIMAALTNSVIDDDSPVLPFVLIPTVVIVLLGLQYLYEVEIPMRWNGQTPGKRALKIAIVAFEPHTALGRRALTYRFLVTFAFNLLSNCYVGFLDSLWLLWDKPYKQCLHDKAAKTVVIKVLPGRVPGGAEGNPW